ncbi:MAG TPA: lysyl oxidase family protein [Saprospiraceae bacterium]|nr:lysyl oxidase family protein [Saprospiraceae bacterium]
MRPFLLLTIWAACVCAQAQTKCPKTLSELVIEIKTDSYGYETAWEVADADVQLYAWVNYNTYANRTLYRDTLCLPSDVCLQFRIYDGFGDGIALPGYYRLLLNGQTIATGGDFGKSETVFFQCIPGQTCHEALPADLGRYTTTPPSDTWYVFVPDTTGIYRISTCDANSCDTKIWVYDRCEGITIAEDNQSTILYSDDETPCAPLAEVTGHLNAGEVYYIRIGSKNNTCTDSIHWTLSFEGAVRGCMDVKSCNYNPLATISDGSCLPQGHPQCPAGPDLAIRRDELVRSIRLDTVHANDYCLIEEGCLRGYGVRQVLRFTTIIENIGERDYYIGRPSEGSALFSFDNCHNHFHYNSYAEYTLYQEDGLRLPIGFKYGFCVTDFSCPPGILPKYGCNNMGISAGCYDNYWADLQCQWIDLTDVPDGRYIFMARINWQNLPDALGQVERDMLNNVAQVCLYLDRSSGQLRVFIEDNCEPYTDCLGKPYGNALPDCTGACDGNALMGDIDDNGSQTLYDAQRYVTMILGNDIASTPCNDLDADGAITVYDAALLVKCVNESSRQPPTALIGHSHCQFPAGITNIKDTVALHILDVNWESRYLDIGISNPGARVNAYQFRMSGLSIAYVENLVADGSYPVVPRTSMSEGMVIGISYQDSSITRSPTPQPLCRIHFFEALSDTICIQKIVDIINSNYERVMTRIAEGCVTRPLPSSLPAAVSASPVRVSPNPFDAEAIITFPNPRNAIFRLDITDLNGRLHYRLPQLQGNEARIRRGHLAPGVYFFRLFNATTFYTGKIVVQ